MSEILFNTNTGELILPSAQNSETDTQNSGVIELRALLFKQDFPYARGDFERIDGKHLDTEKAVFLGRLIAPLFQQEDSPNFDSTHLARLDILGILPNRSYIQRNFRSITNYRKAIGVEGARNSWKYTYDHIPMAELIQALLDSNETYGQSTAITKSKIETFHSMGLSPDYKYLRSRGLMTRELNESLGFADVQSWDIHDYVAYGAEMLRENGINAITEKNLDLLSSADLGPSRPTVLKYFGSLPVYRSLCIAERLRESEIESARKEAVESHFKEVDYRAYEPTDPTIRAATWAKYHVAADCVHGPIDQLIHLSLKKTSTFSSNLKAIRPNLTDAHIETVAISLGMFDDIWKILVPKRSLNLSLYYNSEEYIE